MALLKNKMEFIINKITLIILPVENKQVKNKDLQNFAGLYFCNKNGIANHCEFTFMFIIFQ